MTAALIANQPSVTPNVPTFPSLHNICDIPAKSRKSPTQKHGNFRVMSCHHHPNAPHLTYHLQPHPTKQKHRALTDIKTVQCATLASLMQCTWSRATVAPLGTGPRTFGAAQK
ncbi:hypothetical protein QC761_0090950 [Podospora bellae-mahoneyi]|uniref:Uncharacterized protein n=1 Tax=Podospora bellae-mahoneyi TaxID=2093777 RepID=A0ABR0FAM9_9PEZI|nr:hypothetical protein QC761_0090950 [Podospora bellae-mahoneyi]